MEGGQSNHACDGSGAEDLSLPNRHMWGYKVVPIRCVAYPKQKLYS